jgi:UDP-N-acetylmuramoylalanine--D-glutamate ligase
MPDHLDKYKNAKEYYKDKENIFRFQKPGDYLILNRNDKNLRKLAKKAKSRIIWYDGNPKNAAVNVAKILGIPKKNVNKALKNFKGLSGRLELIAEKNGVKYYNDTTATTPDAAIYALKSLNKYKGRIILIAGGVDKKLDYKKLAAEIPKYCKALILFKGPASQKIKNQKSKIKFTNQKLKIVDEIQSMKNAINAASKFANCGDIILLSPAAASFNLFKNEFDRGNQFNKFVKRLK